uniref:HicA-like toxin n=1 Tax=Mycobacterium phage BobbyK TaxID=3158892 RepID=A0AAU8GPA0_9CAUD
MGRKARPTAERRPTVAQPIPQQSGKPVPGCGRKRGLGSNTEVRALVTAVLAVGGEVKQCRGHFKVYVGGVLTTTLPSTPSDTRSLKNAIAHLRRAGLPLTTKGRPDHG